jgi:hypothetical protein
LSRSPPGLGGLLVDLVQAGPHRGQVPAAGQRGGGAGGGLDLPDVPGDLRHEGRVRRWGAGGGAAVSGRGGLVWLVASGCVLADRAALGRVAVGLGGRAGAAAVFFVRAISVTPFVSGGISIARFRCCLDDNRSVPGVKSSG